MLKKKNKSWLLLFLSIVVIAATSMGLLVGCVQKDPPPKPDVVAPSDFSYFPKFKLADKTSTFYSIKESVMTEEEFIMVSSIQGILAQKNKSSIYIEAYDNTGGKPFAVWKKDLVDNYGITFTEVTDPWVIIDAHKAELAANGYVLYKNGPVNQSNVAEDAEPKQTESLNAATMVAGVKQYLLVGETLQDVAVEHGLTKKYDCTAKTESEIFNEFKGSLSKDIVIHQSTFRQQRKFLRDYAVATKAPVIFTSTNKSFEYQNFIVEVMEWSNKDIPVFGFGFDELSSVSLFSEYGKILITSDWCPDFSFTSAIEVENIKQSNYVYKEVAPKKNTHYVAFLMTDGDNIGWAENSYYDSTLHFDYKGKGTIPMTFGINPSMHDLAPSIMKKFYEKAAPTELFMTGVSGQGYINPTVYEKNALDLFAARANVSLKNADIEYINLLDNVVSKNAIIPFGKQPNIKGGAWMVGNCYSEGGGGVYWANDKPFVTMRDSIWSENPLKLSRRLQAYKKDYTCIEGYSLVSVHAWTSSMSQVRAVQKDLEGKNVELIDVKQLLEMVRKYVPHNDVETLNDTKEFDYSGISNEYLPVSDMVDVTAGEASTDYIYDFNDSIQGWNYGTSGKENDIVSWRADWGALELWGQDFGSPDDQANTFIYKKLKIPTDPTDVYVQLRTRSGTVVEDAKFKIRVINSEGKVEDVTDFIIREGEPWITSVHSLKKWMGQDVILVVEQHEYNASHGEHIFVDDIEIKSGKMVEPKFYMSLTLSDLSKLAVDTETDWSSAAKLANWKNVKNEKQENAKPTIEAWKNVYKLNGFANFDKSGISIYNKFAITEINNMLTFSAAHYNMANGEFRVAVMDCGTAEKPKAPTIVKPMDVKGSGAMGSGWISPSPMVTDTTADDFMNYGNYRVDLTKYVGHHIILLIETQLNGFQVVGNMKLIDKASLPQEPNVYRGLTEKELQDIKVDTAMDWRGTNKLKENPWSTIVPDVSQARLEMVAYTLEGFGIFDTHGISLFKKVEISAADSMFKFSAAHVHGMGEHNGEFKVGILSFNANGSIKDLKYMLVTGGAAAATDWTKPTSLVTTSPDTWNDLTLYNNYSVDLAEFADQKIIIVFEVQKAGALRLGNMVLGDGAPSADGYRELTNQQLLELAVSTSSDWSGNALLAADPWKNVVSGGSTAGQELDAYTLNGYADWAKNGISLYKKLAITKTTNLFKFSAAHLNMANGEFRVAVLDCGTEGSNINKLIYLPITGGNAVNGWVKPTKMVHAVAGNDTWNDFTKYNHYSVDLTAYEGHKIILVIEAQMCGYLRVGNLTLTDMNVGPAEGYRGQTNQQLLDLAVGTGTDWSTDALYAADAWSSIVAGEVNADNFARFECQAFSFNAFGAWAQKGLSVYKKLAINQATSLLKLDAAHLNAKNGQFRVAVIDCGIDGSAIGALTYLPIIGGSADGWTKPTTLVHAVADDDTWHDFTKYNHYSVDLAAYEGRTIIVVIEAELCGVLRVGNIKLEANVVPEIGYRTLTQKQLLDLAVGTGTDWSTDALMVADAWNTVVPGTPDDNLFVKHECEAFSMNGYAAWDSKGLSIYKKLAITATTKLFKFDAAHLSGANGEFRFAVMDCGVDGSTVGALTYLNIKGGNAVADAWTKPTKMVSTSPDTWHDFTKFNKYSVDLSAYDGHQIIVVIEAQMCGILRIGNLKLADINDVDVSFYRGKSEAELQNIAVDTTYDWSTNSLLAANPWEKVIPVARGTANAENIGYTINEVKGFDDSGISLCKKVTLDATHNKFNIGGGYVAGTGGEFRVGIIDCGTDGNTLTKIAYCKIVNGAASSEAWTNPTKKLMTTTEGSWDNIANYDLFSVDLTSYEGHQVIIVIEMQNCGILRIAGLSIKAK